VLIVETITLPCSFDKSKRVRGIEGTFLDARAYAVPMSGSLTDVAGIRVGQVTDPVGRTGVTVVLPPAGSVASGEVRGGAPGTREFELLAPERMVAHADAVVLAGGSAFGLAACDGAMRWCEEQGLGVPTPGGRVPIVVGAVIFDLAVGDPAARPDAEAGYAACAAASDGPVETGTVGAGTGATAGHVHGAARAGGVGSAAERSGDLVVAALVVANPFGDRHEPDASLDAARWPGEADLGTNTTIGVLATNARLDKTGCLLLAQSGHGGIARALEPSHTLVDGDALVALSCGEVEAPLDQVRALGARAVAAAIHAVLAPR
jgi:L-aminopeptidase/D-esterase-like protein